MASNLKPFDAPLFCFAIHIIFSVAVVIATIATIAVLLGVHFLLSCYSSYVMFRACSNQAPNAYMSDEKFCNLFSFWRACAYAYPCPCVCNTDCFFPYIYSGCCSVHLI